MEGERRRFRSRADRGDRGRDTARCDRLPHPSRRDRRPPVPVRPPGPDLLGCARHLPGGTAFARGRSAGCGSRPGAGRAPPPGLRAPAHPLHRTVARDPCRAHQFRRQTGPGPCRNGTRKAAVAAGPRGDRRLRHLRCGGHLCHPRPVGRDPCRPTPRPETGDGLDPGGAARPACGVLLHAGGDRLLHRADCDRDPASAADRGRRGRGTVRPGAEGLQCHAAQAQPGAERKPGRPRPAGADGRGPGAGERRPLARA